MSHPYDSLTPDTILQAIESLGYETDGRMLALNSYENRVLQIGIEEDQPLIGKFYRPGRWSQAAILEDHQFSLDLAAEEIPVVPPIADTSGNTLFQYGGFHFAIYPRQGGRWPELDQPEKLEWIGRFLARIHNVGSSMTFQHRPSTDSSTLGEEPAHWLLESDILPLDLASRYQTLTRELLEQINAIIRAVNANQIRLHGDCHPGNILWTDQGPHFVDMDDCRMGPAVQDIWMLLSGERQEMTQQLHALLDGYRLFRQLNATELRLLEPLRTLRLIHYAVWLARRWDDPAFPLAFPWFNSHTYWRSHLNDLEQQLSRNEEPPLTLY